jgi:uncharacterized protein involved in outer membrane biogenesis
MKRLGKIIIWLAVSLTLLLIIAVALVSIFFPKEKAKTLTLDRLSSVLNRQVTIEDVDVSFWGGLGVYLEGIKISNPDGFVWDQFLEASALDIKLQIWPLLKKEIAVDRLILVEPKIGLLKTRTGQMNYIFGVIDSLAPSAVTEDLTEEAKIAAAAISFEDFSIKNGAIDYINDSSQISLSIQGLDLNSRLRNPDQFRYLISGDFAADSVKVKTQDFELPTLAIGSSFNSSIDTDKKQAVINDTKFGVNDIEFNVKAGIPNIETFDFINLELNSDRTDIARFVELLPMMYRDLIEPYAIGGNASLSSSIKYNSKAKKANKVGGNARFDIDCTVLENSISGYVGISDIANLRLDSRLEGKANLHSLEQLLGNGNGIKAGGTLDFSLSVAGAMDNYYGLALRGNLNLENGSFSSNDLPEPIENCDIIAEITPTEIIISKLDLRLQASDFAITGVLNDPFPYLLPGYEGTAKRPYLKFMASSGRFDYDRLFPDSVASQNTGQGTKTNSPPQQMVPLPDIDGEGKANLDTLIYSGVEITNSTGDVIIKNRVISINNITGDIYTGKIDGAVAIDLNDFENPHFSGNYNARQIEVNDFLDRFTGFGGHLFGKIDMAGNFGATGWDPEPIVKSLTMDGDATIKEGKIVNFDLLNNLASQLDLKAINEETIRDLASHFRVENGRVGLDNFSFSSRAGDWSVGGSVGFDGSMDYKGTVLLSEKITANLMSQTGMVSGLAGLFQDKSSGRVKVPFKLGGDYTNPSFSIDLSSDNLIKEKLSDGIKNLFKKN